MHRTWRVDQGFILRVPSAVWDELWKRCLPSERLPEDVVARHLNDYGLFPLRLGATFVVEDPTLVFDPACWDTAAACSRDLMQLRGKASAPAPK